MRTAQGPRSREVTRAAQSAEQVLGVDGGSSVFFMREKEREVEEERGKKETRRGGGELPTPAATAWKFSRAA